MTSEGWKCPGCGKCYAPWVAKCETCGNDTSVLGYDKETGLIINNRCFHEWYSDTGGTKCSKCGVSQYLSITPCQTCCCLPGFDHISTCYNKETQ